MVNFEVEQDVLAPYLPAGTELDEWQGRTYLTLVGLQFRGTRLCGVSVPAHRDFEEINLRFYVRRKVDDEWRRGVVFIREVVPRRAISIVARLTYNEAYMAMPVRSEIERRAFGEVGLIRYQWGGPDWHTLEATTTGRAQTLVPGSEEEFITEHFWGYVLQRNGSVLEYEVRHPRWRVWQTESSRFDCDIAAMYGEQFVPSLSQKPVSAFVAEGSVIQIFRGRAI